MAWIELHQSVWTHRKTLLLADYLDLNPVYAATHVIHLWTWALDNAPDGDLSGLPPRVIAAGASWTGDAEAFVLAVIRSGYLERDGDALTLHDWEDYAGRLIDRRHQQRERMRQARANRETPAKERAHNVRITSAIGAQLPNPTVPNQTKPEEKDNPPTPQAGESEVTQPDQKPPTKKTNTDYSADFDAFWAAYPRRVAKKAAYKQWLARIRKGAAPADLITAAKHYASIRNGQDEQYTMQPETFLGPHERWRDHLEPPRPGSPPAVRGRSPTTGNVILHREPKGDAYYADVYVKFGEEPADDG